MKKLLLLFAALFFCFTVFGQISFNTETVIDDTYNSDGGVDFIYVDDIDGDGDMDILSASNNDDEISWYENFNNEGLYSKKKIISTQVNGANSVYAADLDGDGDLDVLSASSNDNKISWYENLDGQGDFGNQQNISTSANSPQSVLSIDIDGDGDMDVLSALPNDNEIIWFENLDGLGNFGIQQTITTLAYGVVTLNTGDIDNDGDIDILYSSFAYSTIAWFENDGFGNFGTESYISGDSYTSVYSSDLDNDGDLDVISSSFISDKIKWFENIDGMGTFGPETVISSNADGATFVFAVDVNNDGDNDVISVSRFDKKIALYENLDGAGNFGVEQILTQNINPNFIDFTPIMATAKDINGDGSIDIVFAALGEEQIAWFDNLNGTGNFSPNINPIAIDANRLENICGKDIDGDGDLDILAASSDDDEIAWYENIDGQGNFIGQHIISQDINGASTVYAADFDGDGDLDVIAGSSFNGKIYWFENVDGQGTFGDRQIIFDNPTNGSQDTLIVYAYDIDVDGDLDVISGTYEDNFGGSFRLNENVDGLGNFGPIQNLYTATGGIKSLQSADINGDGILDLVVSETRATWWKNTGSNLNINSIDPNSFDSKDITTSDFDGDGDLDVLVAFYGSETVTSSSYIAWYENTDGLGNFGSEQVISELFFPNNVHGAISVYSEDIDNDGDKDALVASYKDDKITWYENIDGLGNFGNQQVIVDNNDNVVNGQVQGGSKFVFAYDIDNDGDKDVLSASSNHDNISWHRNLGVLGNSITGLIQLDLNSNGCNNNDLILNGLHIISSNGNDSFSTFNSTNGGYQISAGLGTFSTTILSLPNYFQSSPISQTTNFVDLGNTDTVDFCIEPIGTINDLNISVYPSINDPRPGFDTTYQIVYKNIGTTQLSGNVTFEFDNAKLNFLNASETIASQTANTITFDYVDLNPFETRTIDLEFNVFAPPTTNIDDVLVSTATVNPVTGDNTPDDNIYTLNQTVIGSYDPNDIRVLEGEQILLADADKYLHYIIRFQNTGTASAVNVNVENILDSKLDWTTMQLESLSHTGRVEITNGSIAKFIFDNINLPDTTSDEPNSHGYIAYKIKPKDNVVVGDIFNSTADIYFDFNPAIITNTVSTEIVSSLSIEEFEAVDFSIYPNPANNILSIEGKTVLESVTIFDINGRLLKTITSKSKKTTLDVSSLSQGLYFIEIKSGKNKQTQKFIKK